MTWRATLGLALAGCAFPSVATVPANAMVRVLDWPMVGLSVAATVLLLWLSRRFFHHALRSYRSASS